VVGVDFAAFCAVDAQSLQRADHDNNFILQVLQSELGEIGDVNHQQLTAKDCFKRQSVGVTRFLECGQGLGADRIGWNHPKYKGEILFEVSLSSDGDAARSQIGLAAASG